MDSVYRQLVLCPAEESWVAGSLTQLVSTLQQLGVLGRSFPDTNERRFLIGDAFLQLFTFMGCAPSIEFTPPDATTIDWHDFVFIQLSPALPQPRWLVDRDSAKPGCPQCRRRMRDWLPHYHDGDASLQCPHCQHSDGVCRWRWYDAGACARQFVSVVNVYPKESLPTETLLSQLQQQTGTAWQYFYLHAPLIEA